VTRGVYAYGLVEADRSDLGEATGLAPGEPLRLVPAGPVAALTHPVDIDEFEGAGLAHNLEDASWLELMVRAHESVVESAMAAGPVVPMRFGSIFSGEPALVAMLTEHRRELERLLELTRGREEWGVKVSADLNALARELVPARAEESSGTNYLRQRQAELRAAEQLAGLARERAAELHIALAAVSCDALLQPSASPDPSVLMKGAYLIARADRQAFLTRAEELRRGSDETFRLDLTGPWPAYSFTSVDVGGPRD
jgi:hypothetical protein